jgi:CRISPR-associated exonuclease Cas4
MDQQPDAPEYIPISRINAFAYCPRRFYYEVVLAEMLVNEHVLEGSQLHTRVDTPGQSSRGAAVQIRRLYLCAPRLGVIGYCDLVEADGLAEAEGARDWAGLARIGHLYPVEYKKGKLGGWVADHVQLCTQALALEEALGVEPGCITQGYLFYYGSARREAVPIDGALRAKTQALLAEARQVAVLPQPPLPITNWRKCRDCSLEPLCLPREVLGLRTGTLKGEGNGGSVPD